MFDEAEEETVGVQEPAADEEVDPEGAAEEGGDEEEKEVVPDGVDLLGEEQPEWLQALLSEMPDKGFRVSREEVDGLSIEAKQLVANLRSMADRKASEYNSAVSKVLDREQTLSEKEALLEDREANLYKVFNHPALRDALKGPEGQQPDPFSSKRAAWDAEQLVADRLGKFLDTITNLRAEQEAEFAKKQEAVAATAEKAELEVFFTKNPEALDPDAFALIKELVADHGFDVPKAWEWVQAKLQPSAAERDLEESRRVAGRGRRGARPSIPPGLSTAQRLEWMRAHEDAVGLDLADPRFVNTSY